MCTLFIIQYGCKQDGSENLGEQAAPACALTSDVRQFFIRMKISTKKETECQVCRRCLVMPNLFFVCKLMELRLIIVLKFPER
jgi:hypothetical protein